MIRRYCDHCNKEIYYSDGAVEVSFSGYHFELCKDCIQLLIDWIKNVK